jgi:hypothetical protein
MLLLRTATAVDCPTTPSGLYLTISGTQFGVNASAVSVLV